MKEKSKWELGLEEVLNIMVIWGVVMFLIWFLFG